MPENPVTDCGNPMGHMGHSIKQQPAANQIVAL